MAGKVENDRIRQVVSEVEAIAKRIRTDVRKRVAEAGVVKNLQSAANQLVKQAAAAAALVEKYAHEIRKELEGSTRKPAARKAAAKPAARKPAAKPAVRKATVKATAKA